MLHSILMILVGVNIGVIIGGCINILGIVKKLVIADMKIYPVVRAIGNGYIVNLGPGVSQKQLDQVKIELANKYGCDINSIVMAGCSK